MTILELGTIGVIAAVVATWQQIRAWLAWPVGLLISHRQVDAYSSGAILGYLHATARRRPMDGYFSSERPHIRSLGRPYRVWYEALREGRLTFWLRGRPVWYRPLELGPPGSPRETTRGAFSYIRGTLDFEAVLAASSAWEDSGYRELEGDQKNRFLVAYHGQSSVTEVSSGSTAKATPAPQGIINLAYGQRLLHWTVADLVTRPPLSLDHLSLRPEIADIAERVRYWIDSKEWCEERGIPWRIGLSLGGAPGTGKTSFARALAVEHNLPIHVFDLAALDNFSLRRAWDQMVNDAPCMALIEDIDAVFEGRKVVESVLKQGIAVTFDAILNCISGVKAADGVLLVVTSNRPETLDPALRRRGRLDLHVEVLGLDRAGRVKMARRILGDELEAERAADEPALASMSPADFQEVLCSRALAERFGDAA